MKREHKKAKSVSVLEIILLITGTFAFAYAIGQSFPSVSAQELCINIDGAVWKMTSSGNRLWSCISGCPPGEGSSSYIADILLCQIYGPPLCLSGTSIPQANLIGSCPTTETSKTDKSNIVLPAAKILGLGDLLKKKPAKPVNPPTAGTAAKTSFLNKNLFKGWKGASLSVGELLGNAAWAAGVYAGIKFVGAIIPGINPALTQAVATSASIGTFVGTTLADLGVHAGLIGATGIGIAVAIVIFFFTYKEVKFEQVAFTCGPWVAPFGGENCLECNNQEFPCTEYQCKSLGQDCELINQGTEDALCVWNNPRDNKAPIINEWEDVLTVGYRYSPEQVSSPPDRGVRVVNENSKDGCVEPWERLTIGITLDEPAICKMSEVNARSYEEMKNNYWSGGISKMNHSYQFSLPSPGFLESNNISLQNGGEFVLYTRCIDRNEQANTANFVFRYCVGDADLTEPQIYFTSINNNAYIGFEQTEVPLTAYVDEPADCKWSRIDQDYEAMENEMLCSSQAQQYRGQIVFPCSTILNGLNDYPAENDYYFRCRDQPELKGTEDEADRITNQRSYNFRLLGSRSLVISDIGPNGTIRDSTDPIAITLEAETFAGANEGAALCSFSATGQEGTFTRFFSTGSNIHTQRLDLAEGDYTYTVRCEDAGGNTDEKTTSFTVEADEEPPVVVRAFHSENQLQIITNEEASCVYSTTTSLGCTYLFEDGKPMTSLDNLRHQTSWDPDKTFYIKCEDEFSNRLIDNQCSIIVRPFTTG